MADKYVFLDRDGVINKDGGGVTEYGYVTRWEDFEFLPGVIDALAKLHQNGFRCIIVSNQQCVGKDICSKEDIDKLSYRLSNEIDKAGGKITKFYYCFHKKDMDCDCRKPKTGLFEKAIREFEIEDVSGFFFVGDTQRDIQAGRTAGLKTILVLSGKTGIGEQKNWDYKPDYVFGNLLEAVDVILGEDRESIEHRA